MYSDFSRHIEKIIEADPDVILLWSDVEYEVMTIFLKKFIEKLTEYLRSNNKVITILYPGPSDKGSDIIHYEKTYGFYLINYAMANSMTDYTNFDDAHLQADKLFTLYCNRGSYERINIIDAFARENMIPDGIVTYRGVSFNYRDDWSWQHHDGSLLSDEDDFIINTKENWSPQHFPKSFFRGFVDVVCESRVDGFEYFFTEKTAKSIIAQKPFLALSSQYYHRYLRQEYGIHPYSEVFDYSFDSLPDINDRIEGIVENIKRLKSMDKDLVHTMLNDKLVHNKKQFFKYGTNRDKMVPASLEFVFNEPYELLGDIDATNSWFDLIRKNGWLT